MKFSGQYPFRAFYTVSAFSFGEKSTTCLPEVAEMNKQWN
uniref:Uncharacterized protein n=1 Tax=Rhizophora mucronata TaxID=61149 RepID=A0A2P2IUM2_RHIMU